MGGENLREWLEREGDAGADAAPILSEHEDGAVTQYEWPVALGQQVAHVDHGVYVFCALTMPADGLAQVNIKEGLSGIHGERRHARDRFLRLPPVACPPAGSGAVQGAGERQRV